MLWVTCTIFTCTLHCASTNSDCVNHIYCKQKDQKVAGPTVLTSLCVNLIRNVDVFAYNDSLNDSHAQYLHDTSDNTRETIHQHYTTTIHQDSRFKAFWSSTWLIESKPEETVHYKRWKIDCIVRQSILLTEIHELCRTSIRSRIAFSSQISSSFRTRKASNSDCSSTAPLLLVTPHKSSRVRVSWSVLLGKSAPCAVCTINGHEKDLNSQHRRKYLQRDCERVYRPFETQSYRLSWNGNLAPETPIWSAIVQAYSWNRLFATCKSFLTTNFLKCDCILIAAAVVVALVDFIANTKSVDALVQLSSRWILEQDMLLEPQWWSLMLTAVSRPPKSKRCQVVPVCFARPFQTSDASLTKCTEKQRLHYLM